jgi:hypothetical protein
LEARVKLIATPAESATLDPLKSELEEVFILSDLEVVSGDNASAEISQKLRTPVVNVAGVIVRKSAPARPIRPSAPVAKKRYRLPDEAPSSRLASAAVAGPSHQVARSAIHIGR